MRLAALAVTAAAAAAAVTPAASRAAAAGSPPTKPPGAAATNAGGNGSHGPPTTPPGNGNGNGNGHSHGHGAAHGSGKGIVQSVSTARLVLTQLDGSEVNIAVTAATRVFVDGRRSAIDSVEPGYVVSAAWAAGKAQVVQAFDLSSSSGVETGVVRSVSTGTVVVRKSDGSTVVLHVGRSTRVLLDGDPTTLRAVHAGFTVVYTARDAGHGKTASQLRFLRPV